MAIVLKPNYYDEFKCTGDKCIDSCCKGWKITVDKKTYNKYKKISGEFGQKLNKSISRSRNSVNEKEYGKINLDEKLVCPMVNEIGLCEIHSKLGEEFLSDTCKTYPRKNDVYGDITEKILTMSCPEVIKMVLLNKEPITFNLIDEGNQTIEKNYKVNRKLYDVLWEVRSLSIEIVQDRSISVGNRTVLIILLCDKIQKSIDSKSYDEAIQYISIFKDEYKKIQVEKQLNQIKMNEKVKVTIATALLRYKLNKGVTNDKFVEICNIFDEELIIDDNMEEEEFLARYKAMENAYNENVLLDYEHVFENYLVQNIYGNFMKAIKTTDLKKEVIRMVISSTILKMFNVTYYNKDKNNYGENEIVDIFYSFAKVIDHNFNFMEEVYNSMIIAGYDSVAYLTILVK
ncbi:MAG: flagellin lysine-N-methylase [Clostridium sp.]